MKRLVRWLKRIGKDQRRDPAATVSFRLTELPPDLLQLTLAFLTGFDLLPLSHVSRSMYYDILASEGEVWQRLTPSRSPLHTLQLQAPTQRRRSRALRLRPRDKEAPPTAKQRYLSRSVAQFPGNCEGYTRGGAIQTPRVQEIASGGSFSFDVVFALLPVLGDGSTPTGGILLGGQSAHARVDTYAYYNQQFVYADPNGNLYCSVMRQKPVVAERLTFDRWYHVALVFDVTGPKSATQRVYLDGELVHNTDGWLHDEWECLTHTQLGTRCITGDVGDSNGSVWYAFNGLVDNCRFWHGALQADEVRQLGNDTMPTSATCSWSMRDVAKESAIGTVSLVRSTTPAERMVRHVKPSGALSSKGIPEECQRFRGCYLDSDY